MGSWQLHTTTWKGISAQHWDLGFATKRWLWQGQISFLYNIIITKKIVIFKLRCNNTIFRTKCKQWSAPMTLLFTYSICSHQAARFILKPTWFLDCNRKITVTLLLQASTTVFHWKSLHRNLFSLFLALLDYDFTAQQLGQQDTKQHITTLNHLFFSWL